VPSPGAAKGSTAGGGDDLANLTTLCAAHHQHGVHTGVIRISGRAPDELIFELPLGRFRSGDRTLVPVASPPCHTSFMSQPRPAPA
jgi:hypothetical protein